MDENDRERSALIDRFYQIYRPIQKRHSLRYHMHSDIYGNNFIKIWEYAGEVRKRCICNVKEESEIECYKRAIEMLISYDGKGDHAGYEQKAEQRAG